MLWPRGGVGDNDSLAPDDMSSLSAVMLRSRTPRSQLWGHFCTSRSNPGASFGSRCAQVGNPHGSGAWFCEVRLVPYLASFPAAMATDEVKQELIRLTEEIKGLQSRFVTLLNGHNELERACKQENINSSATETTLQQALTVVNSELEKLRQTRSDQQTQAGSVAQRVAVIESKLYALESKTAGTFATKPKENLSAKREVKSLTKYSGKVDSDFHDWKNNLKNVFEQVCEDVLLVMEWADSKGTMDEVTEGEFKRWVNDSRYDQQDMSWAANQLYHILFATTDSVAKDQVASHQPEPYIRGPKAWKRVGAHYSCWVIR